MRLVLLGPPGVGKGTQGRRLAADNGWALISTGEILRGAVARKTPLGIEAQRKIDAGFLVPDDVMIGLVRDRITEQDAERGFVLDGFPRTVPQAVALDEILSANQQRLDSVVSLTADEPELVRRLSARRECPTCKRAYNLVTAPPRDGMHCDDHAEAELIQRADDEEHTIQKRLRVYREQTAPLIDFYGANGRLVEVGGVGAMDDVYRLLRRAVGCPEKAS